MMQKFLIFFIYNRPSRCKDNYFCGLTKQITRVRYAAYAIDSPKQTMESISKYASLVKFAHTIFALPFALTGMVYGFVSGGGVFSWWLVAEVLLCMVFARNTAMGFNRWADRRIDADNPRTARREIPAGRISPRNAMFFVVANALLFCLTACFVNPLAGVLSPVAIVVICGYSYTKRFTSLSHLILGVAMAIAPAGAYIAVTGTLVWPVVALSALVLCWGAGFDILYSMQDADFDRNHSLHSIPARFGVSRSIAISVGLHVAAAALAVVVGLLWCSGMVYWIGCVVFVVILVVQHLLSTASRIDRIGATFTTVNGLASILYAATTIADLLLR